MTDQTLEPTQVAGFNQFFDDPSATQSTVWGAAIDQKFGKTVFGGLEYTRRELMIPQTFPAEQGGFEVVERAGDEHLARAYLFAAPHRFVTFGAEYQYEKFDVDPEAFLAYSTVKTHRVPLERAVLPPLGLGRLPRGHLSQAGRGVPHLHGQRVPSRADRLLGRRRGAPLPPSAGATASWWPA